MQKIIMGLLALSLLGGCGLLANKETPTASPLVAVAYPQGAGVEDSQARQALIEKNPISESFMQALTEFSYQTAVPILNNSKGNANYSPLSLYFALALAGTGAGGETQKEIFSLLGASTPEQLSLECANLYRVLYADNQVGKVKFANSVWLDQKISFQKGFLQNAAKNFYASSFSVDFAQEATAKAMGQWIAENTNSTLTPDFPADPAQVLSIINTVYLSDEWVDRFDEKATAPQAFHGKGGDVTVDFMNKTLGSHDFSKGKNFIRSGLNLKNNGRMVFVLPDSGVSIAELLDSPQAMQALFEGGQASYGEVVWQIPKFKFDSKYELGDTLKTLGVTSAFGQQADFSGIAQAKTVITGITQQTHIAINEKGVEASAFTQINYAGAALPKDRAEMILNRPFLYGITAENGALLFVGVCENPTP